MKVNAFTAFVWAIAAASVQCELATYTVLSPSPTVSVIVKSKTYTLKSSTATPLVHVGTAPGGSSYRYVIKGKKERATRSAIPAGSGTQPEFFDRPNQVSVPHLPKLYNNKYSDKVYTSAHLENEIGSIHFSAPASEVKKLYASKESKAKVISTMTFINSKGIQTFTNSTIAIGGESTRDWAKKAYKFSLSKDSDGLYGLRKFKLRAEATEPTMIREKLYYDMLDALGLPSPSTSYVRLFINNDQIGLFLLVDEISNPWLKSDFNGGKKYDNGILYKMDGGGDRVGANLAYVGTSESKYSDFYAVEEESGSGEKSLKRLIDFTKWIKEKGLTASTAEWDAQIDTDGFLKHMALEFLNAAWDNYWVSASNYYIYHDPKKNQLQWISYDLDYTIGNGIEKTQKHLLTDTYSKYAADQTPRPLIDTLLKSSTFKKNFEKILKNVLENLYKPEILNKRIDGLVNLIQDDVAWDRSLKRVSKGDDWEWDLSDFKSSIIKGFGEDGQWYGLKEWISKKYAAVHKQL
ncbi:coth protein-domain-containing protein [Umbelopsis sp. AD052]|nr:coth protein-domain-containing protein [Umbelopsis sp. AD052]